MVKKKVKKKKSASKASKTLKPVAKNSRAKAKKVKKAKKTSPIKRRKAPSPQKVRIKVSAGASATGSGVKSKKESRRVRRHVAIAAFLFNLVLPGFGTIIGGAKKGAKQLLLWGFSWVVGIFLSMLGSETMVSLGYIIGFGGATIAWVWAFGSSVSILRNCSK